MVSQLTVGKTAMMVARVCCFQGMEFDAVFLSNLYVYPSDAPEAVNTESCCGTPSLWSGKKITFSWYNDALNQKISDIGSVYIESSGFAVLAVPITEAIYNIYKNNLDTYGSGNFAIKAEINGITTSSASKIFGMTIIPTTTDPTDTDPVEHEENYFIDYVFGGTDHITYAELYNAISSHIETIASELAIPFEAATGMELKYVYCVRNDTKQTVTLRVTTYNPNVDNPTLMPILVIAPIVWKILVAVLILVLAAVVYYYAFIGTNEGKIESTPEPSPDALQNLVDNNSASDVSSGAKEGGMYALAGTFVDMSKNWTVSHRINDVDKAYYILTCCFVADKMSTTLNDTCFQNYAGFKYSELTESEKNDFGHLQSGYISGGLYTDKTIMKMKGATEEADAIEQLLQQYLSDRDALINSSASESDLYNNTGESAAAVQDQSDGIWGSFTDDGSGCAFDAFGKCIITNDQAKVVLIGTMLVGGVIAFGLIKSVMPSRK